jgi:hypothetical protein
MWRGQNNHNQQCTAHKEFPADIFTRTTVDHQIQTSGRFQPHTSECACT